MRSPIEPKIRKTTSHCTLRFPPGWMISGVTSQATSLRTIEKELLFVYFLFFLLNRAFQLRRALDRVTCNEWVNGYYFLILQRTMRDFLDKNLGLSAYPYFPDPANIQTRISGKASGSGKYKRKNTPLWRTLCASVIISCARARKRVRNTKTLLLFKIFSHIERNSNLSIWLQWSFFWRLTIKFFFVIYHGKIMFTLFSTSRRRRYRSGLGKGDQNRTAEKRRSGDLWSLGWMIFDLSLSKNSIGLSTLQNEENNISKINK